MVFVFVALLNYGVGTGFVIITTMTICAKVSSVAIEYRLSVQICNGETRDK